MPTELQNTTDAAAWTDEFMRLVEAGMTIDWGTMVGWFANAIEVGREAGRKAHDDYVVGLEQQLSYWMAEADRATHIDGDESV